MQRSRPYQAIILLMYLAFIDESGDPGLRRPNPEYPVFALAAVVCLEREYAARIEPQLRQFRESQLGKAGVGLSAREIAKQHGPCAALTAREPRRNFSQALSDLLTALPVTLIAACLNKTMHAREYGQFEHSAYEFTLPFLMERLVYLMAARHDSVSVSAQAHGKREDAALRVVWERHLADGSYYHAPSEFASRLTKLEVRRSS